MAVVALSPPEDVGPPLAQPPSPAAALAVGGLSATAPVGTSPRCPLRIEAIPGREPADAEEGSSERASEGRAARGAVDRELPWV
ncbi:MAG TPA: hypothetical protein VMD59_19695, partial [Acidimicrobiales bacterium]|nr:hypothetical protein [Acidimicrobiales bacterium]